MIHQNVPESVFVHALLFSEVCGLISGMMVRHKCVAGQYSCQNSDAVQMRPESH